MFDGDVSKNIKAVKQAAKDDEICGRFFITNPDFELNDFNINELSKVAYQMIPIERRINVPSLEELQKNTANATSGKDFVKKLHNISTELLPIDKGEKWGKALMEFARKNPKKFGSEEYRTIINVRKIIYKFCSSNCPYEVIRQKYMVDPESGQLIKRDV